MCPFVVFVYAKNLRGIAGWGMGIREKQSISPCPVSARTPPIPALHFQRACRQCVHESARLFRVMCSHAWQYDVAGSVKLTTCTINPCRTHLPRTARATNSCTPHGGSEGGRRESSLLTFGTFGHAKVRERKSCFMFLLFQSSFRLSEKNEKDKKRNAFLF